jgi:hypothetical protein
MFLVYGVEWVNPSVAKPMMRLDESSPRSPVQPLTVGCLASAWFHILSRPNLGVCV